MTTENFPFQPWPTGIHYHQRTKSMNHTDYVSVGKKAIAKGHVAFCVMAGGQGTRLGCNGPKGKVDPGLLRSRSLFQIQAERLISWIISNEECTNIPLWLIMTSHATHQETVDFFKENEYFGYHPKRIIFFQQGTLPCLGPNLQPLFDKDGKQIVNPDGSGGIFPAMNTYGIHKILAEEQIKILYVYNVDNLLVKLPDEEFFGWMISENIDVTTKVVRKTNANEAVGVFCKNIETNKPCVVEYSELPQQNAKLLNNELGGLAYWAGNAGMYGFSGDFLRRVAGLGLDALKIHRAWKKVPNGDEPNPETPNAWKQETFIFDWYFLAENFHFWEIHRETEFAPLKNADPSLEDSPGRARALWNKYWIRKMLGNGVCPEPREKLQEILSKETKVDRCWVDVTGVVELWGFEEWQSYKANHDLLLPLQIKHNN